MPPRTYKCKVCGSDVSKRQSYAYEDGRACRSHQEVVEHHEKAEEKRVAESKKRETERNRKIEAPWKSSGPSSEDVEFLQNTVHNNHYCFVCKKDDGLTPQEFYLEHAVDIQQYKKSFAELLVAQLGADKEAVESNMLQKNLVIRSERVVLPCGMPGKMKFRIDSRIWFAVKMGLVDIHACGKCRKKHDLKMSEWYKKQIEENQKRTGEKFSELLKTNQGMGVLAAIGAAMKPIIDEKIEEREREQAKNN